jgi:hypothetical protein
MNKYWRIKIKLVLLTNKQTRSHIIYNQKNIYNVRVPATKIKIERNIKE